MNQNQLKEIFQYRDGNLYWKVSKPKQIPKIGDLVGCLAINHRYKEIRINSKNYLSHRLIFLYHNGYLPKYIDHIDRNKLNNRIENLRDVTQSQNMMNRKPNKNSSSQYKGVSWDKRAKKWKVTITINYKNKHLGYFIDEIDAAKAYNDAAIKYFGEYSYLNEV